MLTAEVASVVELDAAEALLALHCGLRESRNNIYKRAHAEFSAAIETTDTAALSLSRLVDTRTMSHHDVLPGPSSQNCVLEDRYIIRNGYIKDMGPQYKHIEPNYKKKFKLHKKHQKEQRRWYDIYNTPQMLKRENNTREKGTQTEIEYQLPQIKKMETIITELCEKIKTLEDQLKKKRSKKPAILGNVDQNTNVSEDDTDEFPYDNYVYSNRRSYERKVKPNFNNMTSPIEDNRYSEGTESEVKEEDLDNSDDDYLSEEDYTKKRKSANVSTDMVPIGDGNAEVPSRLLRQLDWSSYTNTTRKLLTAVFSRRILATHSLTGKPSPAFPDKPAKKKLDPTLVNDIIQTVIERCGVPENVVRTSITTKCADESKMYRSRQQNKVKRQSFKKENVPPATSSQSPQSRY